MSDKNSATTQSHHSRSKKRSTSKQFDYTFKIVMIGDSGVGKSCILLRYADDKFNDKFYATIGVDFRFKNIIVDDKSVKLQIWDTAGQERFKTITSAYYRGAHGILIVYDVTDPNSFDHVKDWLEEINKYSDNNPIKLIIGNKCDLTNDKKVTNYDMNSLKQKTGIDIIEVSAKNSIRINEMMEIMTKKLIEKTKNSNGNFENKGNNNGGEDKGYSLNKENIKNNNNSQGLCC